MHRKVIKISSGGVHNICIIEPQPSELMEEVYKQYIDNLYTDVVFKGFYQTFDTNQDQGIGAPNDGASQNINSSQYSNSDEEMRDSCSI